MPTSGAPITNALSFDIEDWFHLVEVEAVADPTKWDGLPSLVVERTTWILDLLDRRSTRATFFVLGWIAERHKDLVREIVRRGHELGTHGHWHRRVNGQTPEEFHADVKRSLEALAGAADAKVAGYRAPSFSITPGCEWAFDVLRDLGVGYDASLFPAARAHGGYPCPRSAHEVRGPGGARMPELPMSVARFATRSVAFSGGGYMRLLPLWMIRKGFEQNHAEGRPVVVYLHPRDFAPDCPRAPMPLHRRFKSYVGLGTTAGKLDALLAEHRFGTCGEALAAAPIRPIQPPSDPR